MANVSQVSSQIQVPFQFSEQRIEALRAPFKCPVSLELFTDPVMLPCGHTVDRPTANNIITTAPQRGQVPQCPLDRIPFTNLTIRPNYSLREAQSVMEQLIHEIQESAKNVLSCIKAPHVEKNPNAEKTPFECTRPWSTWEGNPRISRAMMFESRNPSSLLDELVITGYKDETFAIGIKKTKENQKELFNAHVSEMGFKLQGFPEYFCISAETPAEIDKAFNFLVKFAELPQPEFALLQRMVELKSWPQAEREMQQSQSSARSSVPEQKT